MSFSLTHKTALITGAGSGIGEAIARRFASSGAVVVLADIDLAAAERVAESIRTDGGSAWAEQLDVADSDAAIVLAARLEPLDVLVNNAGIGHVGTLLTTKASDLDKLYQINVRGVFACCKAFVPAMLEAIS